MTDNIIPDHMLAQADSLGSLMLRLLITVIVQLIIIRGIYYHHSKKEEDFFAFSLIGLIVFLICILLKNVVLNLGMAFGLFAVFTLLTFRSKKVSLKSMAYFFTVIGVSVINALAFYNHPILGPLLINGVIVLSVFLLEMYLAPKTLVKIDFVSDQLELLTTGPLEDIIKYLSSKSGKQVVRFDIQKVDWVKKSVDLVIYCKANS
jgi:hypothetical protein